MAVVLVQGTGDVGSAVAYANHVGWFARYGRDGTLPSLVLVISP